MFDVLLAYFHQAAKNNCLRVNKFKSITKKTLKKCNLLLQNHGYKLALAIPLVLLAIDHLFVSVPQQILQFWVWFIFCFILSCIAWFVFALLLVFLNLDIMKNHFYLAFLTAILLAAYSIENSNTTPVRHKPNSIKQLPTDSQEEDYYMECDGKGCYSDY